MFQSWNPLNRVGILSIWKRALFFDGDGLTDAWATGNTESVYWINDGAGTFTQKRLGRSFLGTANKAAVLDYDADSRHDLLESRRH